MLPPFPKEGKGVRWWFRAGPVPQAQSRDKWVIIEWMCFLTVWYSKVRINMYLVIASFWIILIHKDNFSYQVMKLITSFIGVFFIVFFFIYITYVPSTNCRSFLKSSFKYADMYKFFAKIKLVMNSMSTYSNNENTFEIIILMKSHITNITLPLSFIARL